jgi:hypothetical protein
MPETTHGLTFEAFLVVLLEKFGCTVRQSPKLDHEYKVDFVISKLPTCRKPLRELLAVQLTTSLGNGEKRAAFFEQVAQEAYAPKNIYLEAPHNLDLKNGGAFTIMVALTHFLMDKNLESERAMGIRVNLDLSYEFTSAQPPSESEPHSQSSETTASSGKSLVGMIFCYNKDTKRGFIERPFHEDTDDDTDYIFHLTDIIDQKLIAAMAVPPINETGVADMTLEMPSVKFKDGGQVQVNGREYSKAISISLWN